MFHNLFLSVLVVFWLPGWVLSVLGSSEPQGGNGHGLLVKDDRGRQVSKELFKNLEELSRLVDIAYCVGTTGIYMPFNCAGRCHEFEGFELIKTFNTGFLFADSCGYIALSHSPSPKRIIVAFRGTYSITNAIVDLSINPQTYVPYPNATFDDGGKCDNCTVHQGFMSSWEIARPAVIPELAEAIRNYPDYQLVITGHSLGGAVAALAGLEFKLRGWDPRITTFGEPRIGNQALADYYDEKFELLKPPTSGDMHVDSRADPFPLYQRVTHINDPVPHLPPSTLNYRTHAGEIFISKVDLPPSESDLRFCFGDADPVCSAQEEDEEGAAGIDDIASPDSGSSHAAHQNPNSGAYEQQASISPRGLRLWELFIGHRDYFHRVGVCLPHFADPPLDGDQKSRWEWEWPWKEAGKDE